MCIRDSARAVSAAAPAVAATAMPTALLVEHMSYEGAGLLARWLPAAGVAVERCAVHAADRLPAVVSPAATGHAALVVMGGPMSAYDDEASPWLPAELAPSRPPLPRVRRCSASAWAPSCSPGRAVGRYAG